MMLIENNGCLCLRWSQRVLLIHLYSFLKWVIEFTDYSSVMATALPGGIIMFLGCLSAPFSRMQYFTFTFRISFFKCDKCSCGLKDELIRFWWPKVLSHLGLTKDTFSYNSEIDALVMTESHTPLGLLDWNDEVMTFYILKVKGQAWHHNVT